MGNRLWTLSNLLSLSRILFVAPISWLLTDPAPESRLQALFLILIAMATDLLDGLLARRLNQVTEFGKIIDPLADKIAAAVVVTMMTFHGLIPFWFVTLMIVRDIVILAGGLYIRRRKGKLLQSNMLGKWTITIVAFYVLTVLLGSASLHWLELLLQMAGAVMLVMSTVAYGRRFFVVLRN
jgi:CDP-diacylglycerol--glycerol-3-phosphate 3-phosphatidyltransferase